MNWTILPTKMFVGKEGVSLQEFVDDLAMTSMARLWDVGKSEPIKVCVQRMGFGVCFASLQVCFIPFALWRFVKGEVSFEEVNFEEIGKNQVIQFVTQVDLLVGGHSMNLPKWSCFHSPSQLQICQVGKASPTEGTLPGSIYIILK